MTFADSHTKEERGDDWNTRTTNTLKPSKVSMSGRTSMQNISRPTVAKLGVINEDEPLGNASPIATSARTPVLPPPTKYVPAGTIANTPFHASFISWALGGLFWTSLLCGVATLCLREGWISGLTVETIFGNGRWTRCIRPQLGLYLASWSLFHILEFWTTATCNVEKLSVDAFLLNNGVQYHAAHVIGLIEYFITAFLVDDTAPTSNSIILFTRWWMGHGSLLVALPILCTGQALRSLAMIHAADSFSHVVSRTKDKQEGHVLVTWGVYRISRHPSYTGFFYWALATQMLLGNAISFIGFWFVLSQFFKWRIIDEEIHLVRYFGNAYVNFRKRTGHWLPVNTTYVPPKPRGALPGVAVGESAGNGRKTQ